MNSESEIAWGADLMRVMRIISLCSFAIGLVEYIALKVIKQQDSCLAYIDLIPVLTISVGITIAGATAVLAAFAVRLEARISERLRYAYRILFLVIVPLAAGLSFLFAQYAPLVETYTTDPDVFCD